MNKSKVTAGVTSLPGNYSSLISDPKTLGLPTSESDLYANPRTVGLPESYGSKPVDPKVEMLMGSVNTASGVEPGLIILPESVSSNGSTLDVAGMAASALSLPGNSDQGRNPVTDKVVELKSDRKGTATAKVLNLPTGSHVPFATNGVKSLPSNVED